MATKKKSTKSTPTKAAVPRKPARKPASRTRSVAAPAMRSGKLHRSNRRFMDFDITEQTIYWLIIGIAVVALAGWVLSMQVQLNAIYDEIDSTNPGTMMKARNR